MLLDEAETLEARSERAECLRAVCHEDYKRGGHVARCEGEEREIRWFSVYSPKVFSAIGCLSGALLARYICLKNLRSPRKSYKLDFLLKFYASFCLFFAFALNLHSQVTVSANLTDGTGATYRTAYLHFPA